MAAWTTYWSGTTAQDTEGRRVEHLGSDQFHPDRMTPGDTVYVISYLAGELHVVARLVVEHVVSQHEAEELLDRDDLWESVWHVVAPGDTVRTATMAVTLTDRQVSDMLFIDNKGRAVPPARNRHSAVDPQTFRSTRQIDAETAMVLEQALRGAV